MALSKIQRNMLAGGSVLPENLLNTSTYRVAAFVTSGTITATNLVVGLASITGSNGVINCAQITTDFAAIDVIHTSFVQSASGEFSNTLGAVKFTATNAVITTLTATNFTVANLSITNAISYLPFTAANGSSLYLSGTMEANEVQAGTVVAGEIQAGLSGILEIKAPTKVELRSDTGSRVGADSGVAYLRAATGSTIAQWTATSAGQLIFPNNTIQTTAWTGTVAAANVTGLATVATSGSYADLSNKPYIPNQNVDTTSTPTFANLTVIGTLTYLNITTENVTQQNVGTLGFFDGTSQTTAWTGTVADSQITSVSTSKVTGLSLIGFTGKLSDGTGQISTSTVNGLSTVGYTNQYADLTGKPNQDLNTTSAVQFSNIVTGGLNASTGTTVQRTLSAGGFPLNSAGTGTIFTSAGQSPSMIVSNYVAGTVPNVYIRGYGQNRPSGTASTAPNVNITNEGARGTHTAPTAVAQGDNLGGFTVGGFDGNNWQSDFSKAPNFMGWYATETWGFDSVTTTSTIRAGSGFNIFVQPGWTQTGINQSRHRMMFTTWTTSTTAPSILNLIMGSGVDGTTATHILANGNSYVGPGRTNVTYINALSNFFGVTGQDTAPDNSTLTATNVINLVTNRRSGTSTRRNQVQSGDSLYSLSFRGQTGNNATGNGVQGAGIATTALETFSGSAYGTSLAISTVNTGTTTSRNRLLLSDRLMQLSADQYQFNSGDYVRIPLAFTTSTWNSSIDTQTFGNTAATVNMLTLNATSNDYRSTTHAFKDASGLTTALSLTTSTAAFGTGVQITTYNRTYGDFYNTTSITTATANAPFVLPLGTAGTTANCSIQNTSQLLISKSGTYNLQFSLQAVNADSSSEHDFWIWLRKNGSDVANGATNYTVIKNDGKNVAALTFNVSSNGTDYYELVCAVENTQVSFPAYAANSQGFTHPAIPSLIVNLIPVGA